RGLLLPGGAAGGGGRRPGRYQRRLVPGGGGRVLICITGGGHAHPADFVRRKEQAMSQYIRHPYLGAPGRLAVSITVGDVKVMVRLNEEEARNIVASLEQNADTDESGNGKTEAWWEYGWFSDSFTDFHEPPLTLCRDDCFYVLLPHEAGE